MEWEERLLIRQREILFRFIEAQGTFTGEGVIVALPDDVALYIVSRGKWSKTAGTQSRNATTVRFVLCVAGIFPSTQEKMALTTEGWRIIFSSETFEVWESRTLYEQRGLAVPLRLGLGDEEKRWMTDEVRRMMGEVLAGKAPQLADNPLGRLDQRQDLDVAVWVAGRMRASVIILGETCREALRSGAKRATQDKRFAPLTLEELSQAQIEITLMSPLIFPVLLSDWAANRIDPTKGYVAVSDDQKKQGWYLPAVHNVITFLDLKNFLSRLATEKACMDEEERLRAQYGQFAVIDWIETAGGLMTLTGPVPEQQPVIAAREDIRMMLHLAVKWLADNQDAAGNIRSILPVKNSQERSELVALGCAGHALAVYGNTFDDVRALAVAKNISHSMRKCLDGVSLIDNRSTTSISNFYVEVSWLRISYTLCEVPEPWRLERIIGALPTFRQQPILWLQTLSLLVDYEKSGDLKYRVLLLREAEEAEAVFRKKRDLAITQLALYPEIIVVCQSLWQLTGEECWRERALGASLWYQKKQQADGSFPQAPGNSFSYTRGTAKIAEALACFSEENRVTLEKCLAWLITMQYTEENTFFLNKEEKRQLVGGFRHDAFNREFWIDASGHIILGAARYLAHCGDEATGIREKQ